MFGATKGSCAKLRCPLVKPGLTAMALISVKALVGAVSLSQQREVLLPEPQDERIVETAVQARHGVTGHNVRYVLAFGTCGVIAAFVIIYFLFFREPAADEVIE